MKFRGVISDQLCMREFNNIVTMVSKLSKECVIRFTVESIYFTVTQQESSSTSQPPSVWCELTQGFFFTEYVMAGVDEQNNEIFLSLCTANLAQALATLKQSAKLIKIKLTKKQFPCLTIEIEQPSVTSVESRMVTHDIPVTVLSKRNWAEYKQPDTPSVDITIWMPSLQTVKNIVERLKTMSPHIELKVHPSGLFSMEVETDMATMTSHFKNLHIEENNIMRSEKEQFSTCRIDIKKFSLFLHCDQVQHKTVLCSIKNQHFARFFLCNIGQTTIQCLVPAVCV